MSDTKQLLDELMNAYRRKNRELTVQVAQAREGAIEAERTIAKLQRRLDASDIAIQDYDKRVGSLKKEREKLENSFKNQVKVNNVLLDLVLEERAKHAAEMDQLLTAYYELDSTYCELRRFVGIRMVTMLVP